jgi:hypothetical protein
MDDENAASGGRAAGAGMLTGKPPGTEEAENSSAAETSEESSTRAALRQAIEKVMGEIEHHEREAQRHWQQATVLRKELRESMSYLQAQAKKSVAPAGPEENASVPAAAKEKHAGSLRRQRGGRKKK